MGLGPWGLTFPGPRSTPKLEFDHIFAQIIECSLSLEHPKIIGRPTAEYVILIQNV